MSCLSSGFFSVLLVVSVKTHTKLVYCTCVGSHTVQEKTFGTEVLNVRVLYYPTDFLDKL